MPRNDVSPEFDFREGVLWITDPFETVRLRGWPDPEARQQLNGEVKKTYRPDFRLLQPTKPLSLDGAHWRQACDSVEGMSAEQAARKRDAFALFRQTIPANYVEAIEKFTSHQWNLLHLLHECPSFFDLLQANPPLAWCLGNNDQFRKLSALSPAYQARWHIHKKQRELLDWLGFSGTEAAVKLMKKVRIEAVAPETMRLLQSAFQTKTPTLPMLSQLESINYGAICLACHPRLCSDITLKLLEEVAHAPAELASANTASVLGDVLSMREHIGPILRFHRGLSEQFQQKGFRSIRSLSACHDKLVAAINSARPPVRMRWKVRDLPPGQFPPAPLAGTDEIIPICTVQDLKREGSEQGNCVATHAHKVYAGRYYVYRMLKPERATVAIVQEYTGFWKEHEIKATRNFPIRPETLQIVRTWLLRSQSR